MTQRSILVVLPLLVLAALWGCENDTSNDVAGGTDKSCIGCHSSEDALKEALAGKDLAIRVNKEEDG